MHIRECWPPCQGRSSDILILKFIKMLDELKEMVKETLFTKNQLTFIVSAPASAGMETCLVNLLEPDDECIICINGVFGGRMADIAERCGAKVYRVESEWGKRVEPVQVKRALEQCPWPKLVALVHAETSTGVLQPLQEISDLVHDATVGSISLFKGMKRSL